MGIVGLAGRSRFELESTVLETARLLGCPTDLSFEPEFQAGDLHFAHRLGSPGAVESQTYPHRSHLQASTEITLMIAPLV